MFTRNQTGLELEDIPLGDLGSGGLPVFFENGGFLAAVGGDPVELPCSCEVPVDLVIRTVTWVRVLGGVCWCSKCGTGAQREGRKINSKKSWLY